jgi:non-canonical purine NTP pyrophosphatase (RdgB/HAM1 family)
VAIVYVATKNRGKVEELRALFAGSGWTAETYPGYPDVEEGDASYAVNAALKAEALRARLATDGRTGAVLGDDSGIEVAALGGRPGVLSARYGGHDITWAGRRALMLSEIAATGSVDRSARFVCALHFIPMKGQPIAVEAEVHGRIADGERGEAGFSYDPLFVYPPSGRTFAELSATEKNAVSHRARAVRQLLVELGRAARAITGARGSADVGVE